MSISHDIKKPFNIIFLLIAVVGIILSPYFYFKSKREGCPTYLISEEVNKVYDSSRISSNLILLDASRKAIKEDVFLVTIRFWNSGNLPIEPEDIRKPVQFKISNCERIVDYSVVSQTNPEITKFSLSPENDQQSLILRWKHLDPNNGAKFQVFYTGQSDPVCSFTGNVLGNTNFVDARSPAKKFVRTKYGRVIYLAGGFLFGAIIAMLTIKITRSSRIKSNFLELIILIALLGVGILILYIISLIGAETPPI